MEYSLEDRILERRVAEIDKQLSVTNHGINVAIRIVLPTVSALIAILFFTFGIVGFILRDDLEEIRTSTSLANEAALDALATAQEARDLATQTLESYRSQIIEFSDAQIERIGSESRRSIDHHVEFRALPAIRDVTQREMEEISAVSGSVDILAEGTVGRSRSDSDQYFDIDIQRPGIVFVSAVARGQYVGSTAANAGVSAVITIRRNEGDESIEEICSEDLSYASSATATTDFYAAASCVELLQPGSFRIQVRRRELGQDHAEPQGYALSARLVVIAKN